MTSLRPSQTLSARIPVSHSVFTGAWVVSWQHFSQPSRICLLFNLNTLQIRDKGSEYFTCFQILVFAHHSCFYFPNPHCQRSNRSSGRDSAAATRGTRANKRLLRITASLKSDSPDSGAKKAYGCFRPNFQTTDRAAK